VAAEGLIAVCDYTGLSKRACEPLSYLILALIAIVITVGVMAFRHRLSGNPAKSVNEFQRAVKALKPERKPPGRRH